MNEQLIVDYKNFLNNGKTERECVEQILKMAQKNGYKDISKFKKLSPGDKVYITKKSLANRRGFFMLRSECLRLIRPG